MPPAREASLTKFSPRCEARSRRLTEGTRERVRLTAVGFADEQPGGIGTWSIESTFGVLGILAAACWGDDPAPADAAKTGPTAPFTSGKRLRLSSYVGPEGVRIPRGFIDTELGVPCQVTSLGDDNVVCLPNGSGTAFEDAACTKPIGIVQLAAGTQALPTALLLVPKVTADVCSKHDTMVRGTLREAPGQVYQAGPGGTRGPPSPFPEGAVAYQPGEEVALVGSTLRKQTLVHRRPNRSNRPEAPSHAA